MLLFWTVANVASAATASAVVGYLLGRHRHELDQLERIVMGVIAGMMFLRAGPILGKYLQTATPFDDWATAVMHVALAVLFVHRAWRLERRARFGH